MKITIRTLFIILAFLWLLAWHFVLAQTSIDWQKWDSLPPNPALKNGIVSDNQPGLAGAYSGISNGALVVAGGANFPHDAPWNGGKKVWWKDIYVLDNMVDHHHHWVDTVFSLPISMAYGVSIVYDQELICIGGENENGTISEVIGLTWNPVEHEIKKRTLTSLPEGFRAVNGYIYEGDLLVHGIQNEQNKLLRLNSVRGTWIELPGCPGPPRAFSVSQTLSIGGVQEFFLFSGRTEDPRGKIRLLTDGYRYDPVQQSWTYLGNIAKADSIPMCIMGASSVKAGESHILVFGGDHGRELMERSRWSEKIVEATDSVHQNLFKSKLDSLFVNHEGFSREILSYHTITNTWVAMDTFPSLLPVTTNAIHWRDGYLITSGEIHPGIRTPVIWQGSISANRHKLGWIYYVAGTLCIVVMIWIVVNYIRRQKTAEDNSKGREMDEE